MKRALAAALAVGTLLAGCASPTINADQAGPFPANYKAIMAAYIRQTYFDPYSMRDVAISAPVLGRIEYDSGWLLCLQANAKNRMGGYTGLKKTAYLVKYNSVAADLEDAPVCETLQLLPWPEMENASESTIGQYSSSTSSEINRPALGITVAPMTDLQATTMGMSAPEGLVIASVAAGSPAQQSGLQQGDVIVQVGDRVINSAADLQAALVATPPGTSVPFKIWHDNAWVLVAVKL